jgi:hypothetical protein
MDIEYLAKFFKKIDLHRFGYVIRLKDFDLETNGETTFKFDACYGGKEVQRLSLKIIIADDGQVCIVCFFAFRRGPSSEVFSAVLIELCNLANDTCDMFPGVSVHIPTQEAQGQQNHFVRVSLLFALPLSHYKTSRKVVQSLYEHTLHNFLHDAYEFQGWMWGKLQALSERNVFSDDIGDIDDAPP